MKISKIQIHNFRGILDESFELQNYTLLVGPNNAGKSTVMDAIRAFYEKDKFTFKKDSDFPFVATTDNESWIEIEYSLSDDEFNSLAEEYRLADSRLRVRKYFKCDETKKSGSIFGYTAEGLSENQFYGVGNVQQGKLGDVVYIPAVSRVDEHTKLSGPSALRDLLSNVLEEVVQQNESFKELHKVFNQFAGNIKQEKTKEGCSLADFESDFSKLLGDWGVSFAVQMKPPSITDIVKQLLNYECRDKYHANAVRPEQYGSGFQRHFIYSLISISPKYLAKKKAKKTKDFAPEMTLILFEEPEAFLHPPQQDVLAASLRELASSESRQVICSTHSSHFVSRNMMALPSLVRLRRTSGYVNAFQVREADWPSLFGDNQQFTAIARKHPKLMQGMSADDMTMEMESVKYCLWMNPDRASAFFANNVLLVEGPTEQTLITRLLADKKIDSPRGGLYVLDCMGKYNIHRFMNILSRLGVSHAVIFDDDNEQGFHPELHQLIRDSKHSKHTVHIESLKGDIEALLAIPAQKMTHKKPQHVMYHYSGGTIQDKHLQLLCDVVSRCISAMV